MIDYYFNMIYWVNFESSNIPNEQDRMSYYRLFSNGLEIVRLLTWHRDDKAQLVSESDANVFNLAFIMYEFGKEIISLR